MPKQLTDRDEEDDEDGKFLERMYFIEEVFSILNVLYGKFLSERLGSAWETDHLPSLKEWIEGNAEAEVSVASET